MTELLEPKTFVKPSVNLSAVAAEYPGVGSSTAKRLPGSIGKEMLARGATVCDKTGLVQSG